MYITVRWDTDYHSPVCLGKVKGETRPDQLLSYCLVQGDERVEIEFTPLTHAEGDGPIQQAFRLEPTPEYVQMELGTLDSGDPAGGGEEAATE